jgi:organic hydroperoxide reductase OsmC/OhrA
MIRKARAVWRGASVPNLDQDTFDRLARDAEQTCPVSRALRAEITLDAKLL